MTLLSSEQLVIDKYIIDSQLSISRNCRVAGYFHVAEYNHKLISTRNKELDN